MLNPSDFNIRVRHFPYTEAEKEAKSQTVLSQIDWIPETKDMQLVHIGSLPNGDILFRIIEVVDEPT